MPGNEHLSPSAQDALALDVLTVGLALTAWVTTGSLVLAVAGGLGEHADRRLIIGLVLVLASVAALVGRERVCAHLREHPQSILVVAAVLVIVAIGDDPVSSPFTAVTLSSIGIAAIVAPARLVWACVVVLAAGYTAGVALTHDPGALSGRELAGVFGQLTAFPLAAVITLGFVRLVARYMTHVPDGLADVRPRNDARSGLLLPAGPSPMGQLTDQERRITEMLARGLVAKQIAVDLDIAVTTVRTHVRNIKRKTGARTIPELAGLAMAFGIATRER